MNLSKKNRDGMKDALAFLNGVTLTEDEIDFMVRVGLSGICLDLGRCLDDLGDKDEEIEALEQNWAAAEETIVHKDNRIAELEAELNAFDKALNDD